MGFILLAASSRDRPDLIKAPHFCGCALTVQLDVP